jgi:hypothetical protein
MKLLKSLLLTSALLLTFGVAQSQEEGRLEEQSAPSSESENHHKHSLSVLLAHVHIGNGAEDGSIRGIQRPSWMLAYNYHFDEKWALGLHGDIILETFFVEREGSPGEGGEPGLLERDYPISLVAAGTFKPIEHLGVILGGGLEFDKSESFGLVRFGLEPNLMLSERIELLLNLSYDIKIDGYNNWNLGFGIAYGS